MDENREFEETTGLNETEPNAVSAETGAEVNMQNGQDNVHENAETEINNNQSEHEAATGEQPSNEFESGTVTEINQETSTIDNQEQNLQHDQQGTEADNTTKGAVQSIEEIRNRVKNAESVFNAIKPRVQYTNTEIRPPIMGGLIKSISDLLPRPKSEIQTSADTQTSDSANEQGGNTDNQDTNAAGQSTEYDGQGEVSPEQYDENDSQPNENNTDINQQAENENHDVAETQPENKNNEAAEQQTGNISCESGEQVNDENNSQCEQQNECESNNHEGCDGCENSHESTEQQYPDENNTEENQTTGENCNPAEQHAIDNQAEIVEQQKDEDTPENGESNEHEENETNDVTAPLPEFSMIQETLPVHETNENFEASHVENENVHAEQVTAAENENPIDQQEVENNETCTEHQENNEVYNDEHGNGETEQQDYTEHGENNDVEYQREENNQQTDTSDNESSTEQQMDYETDKQEKSKVVTSGRRKAHAPLSLKPIEIDVESSAYTKLHDRVSDILKRVRQELAESEKTKVKNRIHPESNNGGDATDNPNKMLTVSTGGVLRGIGKKRRKTTKIE